MGYGTQVTGSNQVQIGNSSTTTYVYGTVQNRSDARDKIDIRSTSLGLDFINKLTPREFRMNYREDYEVVKEITLEDGSVTSEIEILPNDGSKARSRFHQGLVAQEVKQVMDELKVDFGGYQDHSVAGGKEVLSIGYDELIAPLIKAVQELSVKLDEANAKIAKLEAKQ